MRKALIRIIVHSVACTITFACNNPINNKNNPQINHELQLQEADSLIAEEKFEQACSILSEIAYDTKTDNALKYKIINSYLRALIYSNRGNEMRKLSRFWFVVHRDTSISFYNELQYFLNYSQSFRINSDYCASMQYMDSLLLYVESNDLKSQIDTSVISGNYIDLLYKYNGELNVDSSLSMRALSGFSHSVIHCR